MDLQWKRKSNSNTNYLGKDKHEISKFKMKKKYYKSKNLHIAIRLTFRIYILMALYLFASVLYDSYIYNLPFYYILFLILGMLIGQIYRYTQSMKWDEEKQLVVTEFDKVGIFILLSFILFKHFVLNNLVDMSLHPIYLTDAIALITLGAVYTKLKIYRGLINDIALDLFVKKSNR